MLLRRALLLSESAGCRDLVLRAVPTLCWLLCGGCDLDWSKSNSKPVDDGGLGGARDASGPDGSTLPGGGLEPGEPAIATTGAPCAEERQLACAAHASKETLVCLEGKWASNSRGCQGEMLCSTARDETQGTCVAIADACKDKGAGELACTASGRVRCGVDRLTVQSEPCQASASCFERSGAAQCECDPGFTLQGDACLPVDDCASTPCGPHAIACTDGTDGFTCTCQGIWKGKLCDTQAPLFVESRTMTLDPERDQLIVVDGMGNLGTPVLLRVALASGERSVLSGWDPELGRLRGTGPRFKDIRALALDAVRKRVILVDEGLDSLLAIDPDTGVRSVVSPAASAESLKLSAADFMTIDTVRDRAVVSVAASDSLIGIDLASGSRTLITRGSGTQVGSGDLLVGGIRGVAVDASRDRALVVVTGEDKLVGVDLQTGNRSTFSGAGTGAGEGFLEPMDVTIDVANDRALVTDVRGALFSVALNTGDRTRLSGSTDGTTGLGTGPALRSDNQNSPRTVLWDTQRGRALVLHPMLNAVLAVAVETGDRTKLGSYGAGLGPQIVNGSSLRFDAKGKRLLVLDRQRGLFSVDPRTGHRTLVSGSIVQDEIVGSGPLLSSWADLTFDPDGDHVWIADEDGRSIMSVELATGDRTLRSSVWGSSDVGVGDGFTYPAGLVMDVSSGRLVVADENVVRSVVPESGDRSMLSAGGLSIQVARDLVVDATNNRYLVAAGDLFANYGRVIAVNRTTGARTLISGNGPDGDVGVGEPFLFAVSGLFRDPARENVAWVTDIRLLEVNLATGDRTLLSGFAPGAEIVGKGVPAGMQRLTFDPETGLLFAIGGQDSVIQIDPKTGDRVVLSRAEP